MKQIKHPAVKKINFSGSTNVGIIIVKLAEENLKPVLMELGGKARAIVLDNVVEQPSVVVSPLVGYYRTISEANQRANGPLPPTWSFRPPWSSSASKISSK